MTPRRARLVSGGLIGLVFLCGVLTGYAVDAVTGEDDRVREREGDRQAWIIERVGLSEDQRAEVDSVVERYRNEIGEVVEGCRDHYAELVAETRTEVKAVLTPEQRERYQALLEAREEGRSPGGAEAAAEYDP